MNATRIAAIATLTFRDAIRSRLLLSLVVILAMGLVVLPMLIEGDGTLFGRIQIIIRYALGFVGLILSIATLWTACGGVAREIEDRRLYLIATKPVYRHEIWMGKWLTIVMLDAGLLLLVGLIISGMLAWTLHAEPADSPARKQASSQLLQARKAVMAEPPLADFNARVQQEVESLIKSGQFPQGSNPADAEPEVRRQMLRAAFSLPPNGSIAFTFRLPSDRLRDRDLSLSFKVLSSQPEYIPTAIQWKFGRAEHQVSLYTTNYPGVRWQQQIPASAVSPDNTLAITLVHDGHQNPATLILAPDGQPPELLVPVGGFGMNLTRALLMLLCRLAFLAALGLSAGCLLSMPVAVFVAFFVMVLLASAGYVENVSALGAYYIPHEGPALEQTWIDHVVVRMFKGFNVITAPLLQLDPIPLLSEGRLISWHMAGRALVLVGGLYTGFAAAAGMALFRRRELG